MNRMNKIINGLLTAGLCVVASGAFAQVRSFNITADPAGTAATTGKYDVQLDATGSLHGGSAKNFRVRWAQGAPSPNTPGNPTLSAQISTIEVTFFSYLGSTGPGTVKIDSIIGNSGVTSITSSHGENHQASQGNWTQNKVKFNGSTQLANKAQFVANINVLKSGKAFLQDSTSNIVTKYRAYSVKVTLINSAGTKVWSGTTDIASVNAPEGSSLALLATGLIPMGMLMRRKASKKA